MDTNDKDLDTNADVLPENLDVMKLSEAEKGSGRGENESVETAGCSGFEKVRRTPEDSNAMFLRQHVQTNAGNKTRTRHSNPFDDNKLEF